MAAVMTVLFCFKVRSANVIKSPKDFRVNLRSMY